MDYTTTALLSSVKRRTMLPTAQILYSDQDIVDMMSEELISDIVPLLMSVREEYLTANLDQVIVSGQNAYDLPQRAIGGKLRDVSILDSNGKETPLELLQPERVKNSPSACGFMFSGDQIILRPSSSDYAGETLRMRYFRRPGSLCLTTACGVVESVAGLVVTLVDDAPSTIIEDSPVDLVKGRPGFRSLADDLNPDDVTGDDVTLSSVPSDLVAGDFLVPAGYSPIPQIPESVHPLLCQRTAVRILEYMGDPGLSRAADLYGDMVDKFKQMVTPRSDGTPKKLVSRGGILGAIGALNG